MKMLKRTLAMMLVLCMLFSVVPMTVFADELAGTDPLAADHGTEEDPCSTAFTFAASQAASSGDAEDYRILHLDCGRKYFTKDWIIALINEMSAAGYNQLQLAFGNDGMRFLLDDMSVTVNGTTYDSADVKAGIQQGNRNYHDFGTNELTEDEMDAILAHADAMGIEIVPHVNMPGHMDAIVDAIEYVGISDAHFTGYVRSTTSLNLNNSTAVAFAQALLQKYVDYFAAKGCKYFHIGADEYANDAYNGNMGFPNIGSSLYTKFANYVNDCAAIVESRGMTPRAWNDGISYRNYTDSFDTDIQVTYWSSGWWGYDVAPSSTLNSNGHGMINTHGDYYYILGKDDRWTTGSATTHDPNLYTEASNWSNDVFCDGSTIDSAGAMFCIWSDYPNFETEQQIAANVRLVLRAMAAEMQELDAASISTDVVSGGFNADGTINNSTPVIPEPNPDPVTKEDPATGIAVTAPELTAVVATPVEELPEIIDAARVVAWDIVPMIGETEYRGSATVSLPVPDGWNPDLVKGFYMENGEAILVTGTYADGFYSFEMPHFSTGGLMERDINAPDETITLEVGGTHEIVIEGADYDGEIETNPTGIASVVAKHEEVVGSLTETFVSSFENNGEYYIQNSSGQYLTANFTWGEKADAVAWTATVHGTFNTYYTLSYDGEYLRIDSSGTPSNVSSTSASQFVWMNGSLYKRYNYNNNNKFIASTMSGTAGVNQSTITFTGIAPGTTYCEIGETTYRIVVRGSVEITVNYKLADGTPIKSETVTVYDDATSIDISNFNEGSKFYVVENPTLAIDPKNQTAYTVIVTEAEEDLSAVSPLVIEYWQTNRQSVATKGGDDDTVSVEAEAAYSENGIALTSIVPKTAYLSGSSDSDPALTYWRARLLQRSTNEQTEGSGDDETLNGTGFTKVRYWNGTWAVYTDAGAWLSFDPAAYQLAAYYMNNLNMADEISVGTSDWGKKGNGDYASSYLGSENVSLAFQVIYEGGTPTPDGTGVELAPYTYFVDAWGNRGVGTVSLRQTGDYQIWKVTAETGAHNVTYYGAYEAIKVNRFTWDGNEMVVWEDEKNPVEQYTIQNPSSNPNTEGYYDNLRWNETNESILIRIYVKTVETEEEEKDNLKVVYYDEKFDAVLHEFPIVVPNGSNFNSAIVKANTTTPGTMDVFKDEDGNPVSGRVNANGYGIVNALAKTQNFQTNLSEVAISNNRYNAGLYKYTGSVISEDGKTITHYYSIDQNALSPNFVADFGLPLSFKLSDVVTEGIDTVQNVTVKGTTLYGTLTYTPATDESNDGTFTYTPTQILPTIDVLTINITFDDSQGPETVTTNVGVTPATTVYYGERFLNFSGSWTSVGTFADVGQQQAAVLGGKTNTDDGVNEFNYGYDDAYEICTGSSDGTASKSETIGDSASFTFTGTGIQVFANSASGSGYVSVMVKNKATGAIANVSMVDTDLKGVSDTTGLVGLPVISLVEVTGLQHATYEVTINKIMDTDPVYIDGIRVFGTVNEANYTADENPFRADEEDNPDFYEVRDLVMKAMNIAANESRDYTTMFDEIYASTVEVGASAVVTNATASNATNRQQLLDKGPKNELYLYQGDTLTLNVSTNRVIQLGLKAPEGTASYQLNGAADSTIINTTVDMFYKIADKLENPTTHTITVKNTGSTILSVTLLKICDDPNASFPALTEENIKSILADAGYVETPDAPAGLAIVSQPVSYEGVVGDMVDFSVEATGEELTYQWYYKAVGSEDWQKSYSTGATTDTLSVELRAYRNGQQYKCVVTDGSGNTVESDAVAMTLKEVVFSITEQPADFEGVENAMASFTVVAEGDNLSYRWQYSNDGGATWLNSWSDGYATPTLSVKLFAYRNGQQYRCVVTNAKNEVLTSDAAALVLRAAAIEITAQPKDVLAEAGELVTFTVEAKLDGVDTLKYRWYRSTDKENWTETWLGGYATNELSFTANTSRASYFYKCVITAKGLTAETVPVSVVIG